MIERWRPVVGYEGRYRVSDQGRVWSNISERELKPGPSWKGYRNVKLTKGDGTTRRRKVAFLVLRAFVGPRPLGAEICHDNDIRTDDRLDNLYWGTRNDNAADQVKNGRHHCARKDRCPRGHVFDEANTYLTPRGTRNCRACGRLNAQAKRLMAKAA